MPWTRLLRDVTLDDVASVGGKNASLGEMLRELVPLGVRVPDGFAVTADAFRAFMRESRVDDVREGPARRPRRRTTSTSSPDAPTASARPSSGRRIPGGHRGARSSRPTPPSRASTARRPPTSPSAPRRRPRTCRTRASPGSRRASSTCAARPSSSRRCARPSRASSRRARSATAPTWASTTTRSRSRSACRRWCARTWRARASSSRSIPRPATAASSSSPRAAASARASCRGGSRRTSSSCTRRRCGTGFAPLVWKKLGTKEVRLVYDEQGHRQVRNERVPEAERARFSLDDDDVLTLARWAVQIEDHYSRRRGADTPMDIEWAKDGVTGELFVVQARPETVHSRRAHPKLRLYTLKGRASADRRRASPSATASSTGRVRVIRDPRQADELRAGEILVTEITDPDWEPIMKIAAGIVTERGGRTSHAAIVARELGIPAIVGAGDATTTLVPTAARSRSRAPRGRPGASTRGRCRFDVRGDRPGDARAAAHADPAQRRQPRARAASCRSCRATASGSRAWSSSSRAGSACTRSRSRATRRCRRRCSARSTRVTAGYADKTAYFVDRLAQGIGTIAAAFHPRPVILRFSDFKTNEYARLVGGAGFEPTEENPMLGWRGASRYYHPDYKEGFLLECAAVKRVREAFGLTNLKLMIPFCRTPEEGRARARGDARGRPRARRARARGLRDGRDPLEHPPRRALRRDLRRLLHRLERPHAAHARRRPRLDHGGAALRRAQRGGEVVVRAPHRGGARARGARWASAARRPATSRTSPRSSWSAGIDSISLSADALVRTTLRVLDVERELAVKREAAE